MPSMANYLRGVLSALLSKYATVAPDELKVSLWQGQLELHDVQLRAHELRRLLPLHVLRGSAVSLAVTVPWTRLLSQSVTLVGSGVVFEVAADARAEPPDEGGVASIAAAGAQEEQEAAAILRQVRQRLRVELSDVSIVIVGVDRRDEVRVHVERLYTGTFVLGEAGDEPSDVGYDDSGSGEFSRCIKVTGLDVRVQGRLVLHSVSAEIVLSFSGSHLSYCNVVVSEELKLTLSDLDVDLLKSTVAALFRSAKDRVVVESPRAEPPPSPAPASPGAASPAAAAVVASPPSASSSSSWTSSVWNYGMSWVSSASAAPGLSSPAKRIPRPASNGSLLSMEAAAATAAAVAAASTPPVLPSWFRFELPLFCVEVVRHVDVVVGREVHMVPRALLQLRLDRTMVEFSHSSVALELIARVGTVSAHSLWEGGTDSRPLLKSETTETDAVSLDWVHRSQDRFVEVTLDSFVLSPVAPVVRELVLFVESALSNANDEEEAVVKVDASDGNGRESEEEEPRLDAAVSVIVVRPRVCLGLFDIVFEQLRYGGGAVACDNLSVMNRECGAILLLPVQRILVDLEDESTVVESDGTVGIRVVAAQLKQFLATLTEFIDEATDDLPEYDRALAQNYVTEAGLVDAEGAVVQRQSRERHGQQSNSPGKPLLIVVHRLCLHVVSSDGVAVADILADSVRCDIANSVVTGAVAGLIVLDRMEQNAGRVLLSTFATDGEDSGLSTKAYAQLANVSFAADVVFASPMYKNAVGGESRQSAISFMYASRRASRDHVPRVATTAVIGELHVHVDVAAFVRLGEQLRLGVSGLDEQTETDLGQLSGAQLKWRFAAVKALRAGKRHTLATLGTATRHGSWRAFAKHHAPSRMPVFLPSWSRLCLYLQAASSGADLQLSSASVVLPGGLELLVGELTSRKKVLREGLSFDRSEGRTHCAGIDLLWKKVVVGRVGQLDVGSTSRLNGLTETKVDVGPISARLSQVTDLQELITSLYASFSGRRDEKRLSSPSRRTSSSTVSVGLGAISLTAGHVAASVSSLFFVDGNVSVRCLALDHKERTVVATDDVSRIASGLLSTNGLRIVLHRDAVEEVVAMVQSLKGSSSGQERENKASGLAVMLRDTCVSLPLGRQSALHFTVARVKSSLAGDVQLKWCCLYFGSLQNLDVVVGGAVKVDSARCDFSRPGNVEVDIGRVSATLQPETDVEHVLFLLQSYEMPFSKSATKKQERSSVCFSARVGELVLAMDDLSVVAEKLDATIADAWRIGTACFAVGHGGHEVLQIADVRLGSQDQCHCESVAVSLFLSHVEKLGVAWRRLADALKKGFLEKVDIAPGATASGNVVEPHSVPRLVLQGGSVPLVVIVVRPFPGFEAVMQLRCEGLRALHDDRMHSLRVTLASAVGNVLDVFSGVNATFLEARNVFVLVGGSEIHCGSESPIGITLSAPLTRCVAALRQGRMEPVFPYVVENQCGWPIVLSGSRHCGPGELAGVARAPGLVQVLAGGRKWCSTTVLDFKAIGNKSVLEVETSDGDSVDLMVTKKDENVFSISGCITITNASGVNVQILHWRPFRRLKVLNEVISQSGRQLVFCSDKGKEEEEEGEDASKSQESLASVHVMSTHKSAFRFRVAGSKWSEATVRPHTDVHKSALVQCGAGVFVWCTVQSPLSMRLSSVCVLENHLPCPLYWTGLDESSAGCVESGAQASYAGHPDNAIFGLSIVSSEQAKTMAAMVDSSKPRSSVALSESLTLMATCFTVSLTKTRHVSVSAPLVLSNQTGMPLQFGAQVWVALGTKVPCNNVPYKLGNSAQFGVGGNAEDVGSVEDGESASADGGMRVVSFEENGKHCQALVIVWRDKSSLTTVVEALPWYEVLNKTASTVIVAQEGLGDVHVAGAGGRAALALWMAPEGERALLRLKEPKSGAVSEEFWAEFGTVRLVSIGDAAWVVVRVHFRHDERVVGFPRVIQISLHDATPPPFVVRNQSPWSVALQEQWSEDVVAIDAHSDKAVFPVFWRDYLQQQRESMYEALAALGSGEKKSKGGKGGSEQWDLSFPASVRNKPFVFRVRLNPGGNWSELVECSRVHFFSMPLYSERGSIVVNVVIAFVGLTKEIGIGAVAPCIPRPLRGWKLSLAMLCVRATGLAELIVKQVAATRRGIVLEASLAEMQVENQVAGATYPLMLFQTSKKRQAVLVRARLGVGPRSNPLAKLSVALSDWGLELDYGSVKHLAEGLAAVFRVPLPSEHAAPAAPSAVVVGLVDEVDVAPFGLLLSWQNPKLLIPVDVWDEMLSIRHLRLQMPGLVHSGSPLSRRDMSELLLAYVKEAFLGQTVRILGSLDVLGNPTGLVVAFGRSVRFLQQTWVAAVEGNGHAMLEGATDAVRTFAGALMTPIVSFSNASARLVGESGALGAIFDLNRRTVEFVSGYFNDTAAPDVTRSPFKK